MFNTLGTHSQNWRNCNWKVAWVNLWKVTKKGPRNILLSFRVSAKCCLRSLPKTLDLWLWILDFETTKLLRNLTIFPWWFEGGRKWSSFRYMVDFDLGCCFIWKKENKHVFTKNMIHWKIEDFPHCVMYFTGLRTMVKKYNSLLSYNSLFEQ